MFENLRPLGAPNLVKWGPFWPSENFDIGFEQKRICDIILALTWPFFIGFWLAIPQNDRTDSRKKMAHSGSLSDQLIISNKAEHFQTLGLKNSI